MVEGWHAPPGYRVVTTDERVDSPAARTGVHLTRRAAERHAERRNAVRRVPFYEWRAVRDGRRWVVAAFQNVLQPIEEARAA